VELPPKDPKVNNGINGLAGAAADTWTANAWVAPIAIERDSSVIDRRCRRREHFIDIGGANMAAIS
jgi:hypothetical protein